MIPYVPDKPDDPTNPDDKNVPTKDDEGKTVDKKDYVIVAFKVADADKTKGSLTLGDKTDQQVISALVKKGSKWDKVTVPTINVADANTKANGYKPAIPAKTETVENGKVYTAQFITNGQEITPGTKLPDGVFEVSVSRDETSVKDNALYGKSYAVFKDSKLAQAKFPTPEAKENFKEAKWNVEGNPWDQAITAKTDFKASAVSSTFDKQNITKIEVIQDPTKMTYTEGDKPNHDGIKVKLTDKNGNTVEVEKDKLADYGITVTPAEDKGLTVKDNNGKPFVAKVNGKDAEGKAKELTANGKANITVNPKQANASEKPKVDQPYAGDKSIKGKGVPGATIVVKDQNGNEIGTTTVKSDGTWEVTVPSTEQLENGETITVTQTEKDKTPAEETATVQEKGQPTVPTIDNPEAKNKPGKDSTTVTGKTSPDTEVTVTDKDGTVIGTGTSDQNGDFTIDVKPKQEPGTEVTITPKDGTSATAKVTEANPNQSEAPKINRPTEGDNAITGTGVPGAKIVVTDQRGNIIGETTVNKYRNWTVPVPAYRPLRSGDTITAMQTEDGKDPAKASTTVKAKDSNSGNSGNSHWFVPVNPGWSSADNKVDTKDQKHETAIHKAYIYGYENGSFKPEGNMTRAEAAAMLARLQGLDLSNSARPNFIDVRSGWYNAAINAVVNAGYMKGYPDGTFRPNGKITRAEFAQMIKAIDKANTGMAPFADAKGHWAEAAINQAYANGRINGYPDGTFRPNNHITRAEAVKVFNKLYDRSVNLTGLRDVLTNIVPFVDVNASHWAYYEIVEASNTHTFYRTEKGQVPETWVMLNQTWKQASANR